MAAILKSLLIFLTVFVLCHCIETNKTLEESRAKKNNRTAMRVLVAFVVLVLSKVAITKASIGFIFWMIFQKFFYVVGLVFSYLMKKNTAPSMVSPVMDYSSVNDYNTVGYSYGPPDPGFNSDVAQSNTATYGPPEWGYARRRKHVNLAGSS